MKSFLVVGLGRFGHHLTKNLLEHGHEVMIIDCEEKKVEDLTPIATSVKIGDCTNPEVLRSLGVGNFDAAFVCIGTNFQSSLEITSQLKEMGARRVVSKATRDIQAKFLLRNGADEVIYPEKDLAEKVAARYSVNHIFDYIELDESYAIYEIPPLREWCGRSIRASNIAADYHVSILGIRKGEAIAMVMPSADYVIEPQDHLMVLSENRNMEQLMRKLR